MWLPPTAYFKRLWEAVALFCLIKVNGGFFLSKKALGIVKKPWGYNPSGLPNWPEKLSWSDGPSRSYFFCDSSSNNNNGHIGLLLQFWVFVHPPPCKMLSFLWGLSSRPSSYEADMLPTVPTRQLTRSVLSFYLRGFVATLIIFHSSVKYTFSVIFWIR